MVNFMGDAGTIHNIWKNQEVQRKKSNSLIKVKMVN